jgi:hypothetical protein
LIFPRVASFEKESKRGCPGFDQSAFLFISSSISVTLRLSLSGTGTSTGTGTGTGAIEETRQAQACIFYERFMSSLLEGKEVERTQSSHHMQGVISTIDKLASV